MSQEQEFEKESEVESLSAPQRQWQADALIGQDRNTMVEVQDTMRRVNQRLADLRAPSLGRTLGDVAVWFTNGCLLLHLLSWMERAPDPNGLDLLAGALAIPMLWYGNRCLHQLDRANAALSLQEYDQRWIGPLFEALAWPNRRIRNIVSLKLRNLLPLMQESDVRYLSPKHRDIILTTLQETTDAKLQLAILKVLPLFGDAAALSIVEQIADRPAWLPGAREVRYAAYACLPRLRETVRLAAERRAHQEALEPQTAVVMESLEQKKRLETPDRSALPHLEREQRKVARPAMRIAFLVADWCVIVPYCVTMAVDNFRTQAPLSGYVWSSLALAATQLYRVSLSPRRAALLRQQAQQRDIKAVGALAEALQWPERDSQYAAASGLTVLLPELKASDFSLLNSEQRNCLHQVLKLENARTQGDLISAILKAFQQVGDSAAIPYVEQLAAASPQSPQEQRIVQEARECLPYLHISAQNHAASHTLLRASSQTDATPENALLRPAREQAESRPEQLLRPDNSL